MLIFCVSPPRSERVVRRCFRSAVTLVEVLLAMALTLLMMAAVVNLFANVSSSIANRRSAIEITSQVRHVRGVLQRDLAGATCPAIPPQRVESNHGYIEIIEGPRADFDPSIWLQDLNNDGQPDDIDGTGGELEPIDLAESLLPSSNLARLPGASALVNDASGANNGDPNAATDGRGLGDWDDALLLTVRNESEPFIGRIPEPFNDVNNNNVQDNGEANLDFPQWGSQTSESTLAEVVWFAVENPVESLGNETFAFGEPGLRTIYRRALLIAPRLNYAFNIGGQITRPGVVRVLNGNIDLDEVDQALAALVAFQERFDLSVRLEFDPTLDNPGNTAGEGRWTLVANSLADLTKRENRYEHFGFVQPDAQRRFPFVAASNGREVSPSLRFVTDTEVSASAGGTRSTRVNGLIVRETNNNSAVAYRLEGPDTVDRGVLGLPRPFVYVDGGAAFNPTPRAITNEDGQVVGVTNGFAPLGGARRGEDVMLTGAAAFDLRVYDPQAPLVSEVRQSNNQGFPGTVVAPGDEGWGRIVVRDLDNNVAPTVFGRGAYVDLGYASLHFNFTNLNNGLTDLAINSLGNNPRQNLLRTLVGESEFSGAPAVRSQLRVNPNDLNRVLLDPYRTYDTWSFHYENNGIDEDNRDDDNNLLTGADEATNGFDDPDPSIAGNPLLVDNANDIPVLGPDDVGERETQAPYDVRLRGVQATIRAYEPDSRQYREVKVSQTFVPR